MIYQVISVDMSSFLIKSECTVQFPASTDWWKLKKERSSLKAWGDFTRKRPQQHNGSVAGWHWLGNSSQTTASSASHLESWQSSARSQPYSIRCLHLLSEGNKAVSTLCSSTQLLSIKHAESQLTDALQWHGTEKIVLWHHLHWDVQACIPVYLYGADQGCPTRGTTRQKCFAGIIWQSISIYPLPSKFDHGMPCFNVVPKLLSSSFSDSYCISQSKWCYADCWLLGDFLLYRENFCLNSFNM